LASAANASRVSDAERAKTPQEVSMNSESRLEYVEARPSNVRAEDAKTDAKESSSDSLIGWQHVGGLATLPPEVLSVIMSGRRFKTFQDDNDETEMPKTEKPTSPPAATDEGLGKWTAWMDDPRFSGSVWHNAAAIFGVVFLTWLLNITGGGLTGCLVAGAFVATYYRNSMVRFRRKARDDIIRQFAVQRLETDMESSDWLNNFLSRFWMIYEPVLSATIVAAVDQVLMQSTPGFLDSLRLTSFTLGTKAPRIEAVKTFPKSESDVVLMDWHVSFVPNDTADMTEREKYNKVNPKIILTVRLGKGMVGAGVPILLEDLVFKGRVRIKIRLMNNFPHIRSVGLSFLEKPTIDYVLKPVGGETFGFDIAYIPGLQNLIKEMVHGTLAPLMYDPHMFTLDLDTMMNSAAYAQEHAIGVLKLDIRHARGLKKVDLMSESDPYVKVHIANRSVLAKTRVIEHTKDPTWDETAFILLHSLEDVLTLDVMDSGNNLKRDAMLGVVQLDLKTLETEPEREDIIAPVMAKGKPYGSLTYSVSYYPVAVPVKDESGAEVPIESVSGILHITISQAKSLDPKRSLAKQYSPYTLVKVEGKEILRTKVLKRTNNPVWEEATEVFVADVTQCTTRIDIMDSRDLANDIVIGYVDMSLAQMLRRMDKSLEWFQLSENSGKLKINCKWRPVLYDGGSEEEEVPLGVVKLNLVEARNLRNVESLSGKSDPYVRVLKRNQVRARTRHIDNNLNPVWGETAFVPVTRATETIVLEVMDHENVGRDRTLGETYFQIKQLLGPVAQRLPSMSSPTRGQETSERRSEEASVSGSPTDDLPPLLSDAPQAPSQRSDTFTLYEKSSHPVDMMAPLKQRKGKDRGELHYRATFYPIIAVPGLIPPPRKTPEQSINAAAPSEADDAASPSSPSLETAAAKEEQPSEGPVDLTPYEHGIMVMHLRSAQGFTEERDMYAEVVLNNDYASVAHTTKRVRSRNPVWEEKTQRIVITEAQYAELAIIVKERKGRLVNLPNVVGDDKSTKSHDSDTDDDDDNCVEVGRWSTKVRHLLRELSNARKEDLKEGKWLPLTNRVGDMLVKFEFLPVAVELAQEESITNSGTLSVDLLDARNLKAVDSSGTSDPYVVSQ